MDYVQLICFLSLQLCKMLKVYANSDSVELFCDKVKSVSQMVDSHSSLVIQIQKLVKWQKILAI